MAVQYKIWNVNNEYKIWNGNIVRKCLKMLINVNKCSCNCNPATLEAKFGNGLDLTSVEGNSPSKSSLKKNPH